MNLLLGLASGAAGGVVYGIAPVGRGTLWGAAGTALALTGALVSGALLEARARRPDAGQRP